MRSPLPIVLSFVLLALLADVVAPYAPAEQYRDATLRPPSLQPVGGHVFLLGTDPVATLRMTTVSQMAASPAIMPAPRP